MYIINTLLEFICPLSKRLWNVLLVRIQSRTDSWTDSWTDTLTQSRTDSWTDSRGFGRSGNMFGSRGWGVKPDIMCFAKGITSAYIPFGATTVNERVADAWNVPPDDLGSFIMHGYTYSGHAVGCAAAMAALNIVEHEDLPGNARRVGTYMLEQLQSLTQFPSVGEVRGKGLMLAIDLVVNKQTRESVNPLDGLAYAIANAAHKAGLIIRPAGTKLIISPPLIFTNEHVDELTNALHSAFEEADPRGPQVLANIGTSRNVDQSAIRG